MNVASRLLKALPLVILLTGCAHIAPEQPQWEFACKDVWISSHPTATHDRQSRQDIEALLNQMSKEGWTYVDSTFTTTTDTGMNTLFLFFKREKQPTAQPLDVPQGACSKPAGCGQ